MDRRSRPSTRWALRDALGLENSVARARVMIAAALAATKLLETGELAERLAVLEAAVRAGGTTLEPVFPDDVP
jgi:hypothetical protein